jgi:hypothetical protein
MPCDLSGASLTGVWDKYFYLPLLRRRVFPGRHLRSGNKKIFCHFGKSSYLCKRKNNNYRIMTTVQLRAELLREMNPLLDNETAMEKVLAFVRGLLKGQHSDELRAGWSAAAKQAHADGADELLAPAVFEDESTEDWQW